MVLLIAGGLASAHAESRHRSKDPIYDPQAAPIIFIPGLLGSVIGCGPDSDSSINLWPSEATSIFDWPLALGLAALELVNTSNRRGRIRSQSTNSAECGSDSFDGGEVAQYEPLPLRPVWCLPEDATDTDPDTPKECSLDFAQDVYASFGLAMVTQLEANDRDQLFIPFAWDWRRSPQEAADALDKLISEVTEKTGVKATVVAHSFGNIVFREWLRGAQRRHGNPGQRVGRFLSVAGPRWGTATAWTHPGFGVLQPEFESEVISVIVDFDTVKSVFQSSPGIYWLFPNRSYDQYVQSIADSRREHWLAVEDDSGAASSWVRYREVDKVVESEFNLCPQSDIFPCQSRRLYREAAWRNPQPKFDRGGLEDFVGLVGAGLATASQICQNCDEWPDGGDDGSQPGLPNQLVRMTNGDLNVPVFSAIQGDDPTNPPGDDIDFLFTCGISHEELMSEVEVLDRTVPYLTGDADLSFDEVFHDTPCALSE